MPATQDFTASVHLPSRPRSVALDGTAVTDFTWDEPAKLAAVKIPACGAQPRVVTFDWQ